MENENDFRVDLHCINSGQTTVRLRMEVTDPQYLQVRSHALLRDEVTFEVRICLCCSFKEEESQISNVKFPTFPFLRESIEMISPSLPLLPPPLPLPFFPSPPPPSPLSLPIPLPLPLPLPNCLSC